MTLNFEKRLDSSVAKECVEFQNDATILAPNFAASRFHETW